MNPQRQVSLDDTVPLDERVLEVMCRRIVEMDVPEYMTRIILEAVGELEAYYIDMTRQLWDEIRHAMMGTIYFENRRVDWKNHIAIHPGMVIHLNTRSGEDAHLVLYAIEQNLMPAKAGEKLEYEISKQAGDSLAAQTQDYDWADEVLPVHIGRQWLLPRLGMQPAVAVKKGGEIRASTAEVLGAYEDRGERKNWWPNFAREVLGRETCVPQFDMKRR